MVGMGSPQIIIQEYNLSVYIPNAKGLTFALIMDSEKGETGEIHVATNPQELIDQAGKPSPEKYGVGIYSALNVLEETNRLLWVRVDKGQLYSSLLVRGKIAPVVDKDSYGYLLPEPQVDPIVKPNGSMSKEDWEKFEFPQYPRKREVGHFEPDVHLKLIPTQGDTRIYVDNVSNAQVGDYITFKDTNDIADREEVLKYSYYLITAVGEEVITQDYIVTQDPIPNTIPVGTEIKKVIEQGADIGATLEADATAGDTTLSVNDASLWSVGDRVTFSTDMKSGVYTILEIDLDNNTLTIDPSLSDNYPQSSKVYKVVKQYVSFNYPVHIKWIDPADNTRLMVDSNDPIAEGDVLEINGIETTLSSKYQLDNKINYFDLDKEYSPDVKLSVGDVVYKLIHTDWEYRDCFLIRAESGGEWGNRISVAIYDSKVSIPNTFVVAVYVDGVQKEEHLCSRRKQIDSRGRQLFIEDVINNQSKYIRVKDNPLMIDENGDPVEPLRTTYHYIQKEKEPLYYKVATAVESIWDKDNYIRVNPEDIVNIDVLKPLQIAGKLYDIAEITKSCAECTYDTIVLKQPIDLSDMSNLLPLDRKLDIGTELKQSFDRAKVIDVFLLDYQDNTNYYISIKGYNGTIYQYTYTSVSGDNATAVLQKLADAINADANPFVDASLTSSGTLRLTADVAGVDFEITETNLSYVIVVENARAWLVYPLERVDGSIYADATIGAIVEIDGTKYIVWDAGANKATGGDDAGYPTIGQYLLALDLFKNPETSNFIAFLDAGVTEVAYAQAITQMCEKRQDCVGLLSVSYEAQANPDIQEVIEYRKNLGINSSYATLTTPWVKIVDKYNDIEIFISPESFVARAIARTEREKGIFYPAFWLKRGKVYAQGLGADYDQGDRDLLYDYQINPIFRHKSGQAIIGGQKTLTPEPSALDRLNTRLLLIVLEQGIKQVLDYSIGDLNLESERRRVRLNIETYLIDVRAKGGVVQFRVVVDETNNTPQRIANHEFYADVYIAPSSAIEYPFLRIGVTREDNITKVNIQPLVA